MIDNDRALELLEQAQQETPFCTCGMPTVPVGRQGGVWLECSAMQGPSRWRDRLVPAATPGHGHVKALIVDLTQDERAA